MEMKMIVRDQSNNYFHLTPKIGPLYLPPPPLLPNLPGVKYNPGMIVYLG